MRSHRTVVASVVALTLSLGLLVACASDGPDLQPSPSPVPALVWDAAVAVGDPGPGYRAGVRVFGGGPLQLVVDSASRAYLSFARASSEGPGFSPSIQGWGNVYQPGSGWNAPVLLAEGTGLPNYTGNGIGFTPDGALFGWNEVIVDNRMAVGLRGFDVRLGWQSPGTLLSVPEPGFTLAVATTREGTPTMAFQQGSDVFVVRHRGVLEGPERIFSGESLVASAADGAGAFVVVTASGKSALRLGDGRWVGSVAPSGSIGALAGRPEGGFVAAWVDYSGEGLRYRAAMLDAAGRWMAPADLGSAPDVPVDARLGRYYNERPRIVTSASGSVAVAWRAGEKLFVTRATGDRWEPSQTVPNAVTTVFGERGFDVAIDASSRLVVAWEAPSSVKATHQAPGQSWSPPVDLGTGGSLLLAVNASGTGFAAWNDSGKRVMMAARLPAR